MTPRELRRFDHELTALLEAMTSSMGRPERRASMGLYVTGLLLDGERKSMQPMAARLVADASQVEAMRQRLQECVVISRWSDEDMFRRLAQKLDRELPGIEALVIDDTGIPKKGKFSVGVARQYSGTLGRVDNCQVGVSLHLAGEAGSGCIAFDLFLPSEWTDDPSRLAKAGVPDDVGARTKIQIALGQIDRALAHGVRRHVVLADAGYGDSTEFRDGLSSRGLLYVVGVNGQPVVWPPESNPQIPVKQPGLKGQPKTRYRDDDYPPEAIGALGRRLSFRKVTWREGTRGKQSSRFAAVRIRTAHHHVRSVPPGSEQWLLVEWPDGEDAPTKHWLSNLPATTSVVALVRLAKLRWRVERDYQDLKGELGLDHFEGRTWRGFHHHATLCAVAHGFLALQRALFPPEETEVDTSGGPPLLATGGAPENRMVPAVLQAG
jgi:SRSO17 transposase